MNQSKKWMVRHEPGMFGGNPRGWQGHPLVADPRLVAARLCQRQYYGEVNSYLRHVLLDLPVAKRGVILRDPRQILVSAMNWTSESITRRRVDLIAIGYRAIDRALQHDDVVEIRFEKMTTDVAYLQKLLKEFGIDDVEVSEATLAKKSNASKKKKIKDYKEVPPSARGYYEAQTGWYREKYYVMFQ